MLHLRLAFTVGELLGKDAQVFDPTSFQVFPILLIAALFLRARSYKSFMSSTENHEAKLITTRVLRCNNIID